MKTVEFSYGGKRLNLYFNGAAMFAISAMGDERPEGSSKIEDEMQEVTPQGFATLCNVAAILAEQGELCRRYLQYPHSRIPTAEELLQLLTPIQMLGLRTAVIKAINLGYTQTESQEDDDIDTGLAELEKKTGR